VPLQGIYKGLSRLYGEITAYRYRQVSAEGVINILVCLSSIFTIQILENKARKKP
jgi:hypothetical protein